MPKVKGPIPSCQRETYDLDVTIAATLKTTHGTVHSMDPTANSCIKVEQEELPTISEADTIEDWTASKLFNTQRALAAGSSHCRSKKSAHGSLNKRDEHKACKFCGEKGHGESARVQDRKKHCSAYGHKCKRCNKKTHLESMCGRKDTKVKQEHKDGVWLVDVAEINRIFDEQAQQFPTGESNNNFDEEPMSPSEEMNGCDKQIPAESDSLKEESNNMSDVKTPSSHNREINNICDDEGAESSETQKVAMAMKKSYVCKVCDKAFIGLRPFIRHQKIHPGGRRKVCHICGASLSNASHLSQHMTMHTGEKRHVCNVCDRAFSTSSYLKEHMAHHTGEKLHVCKICDKTFNWSSGLFTHMKIHTGERPHVCNICGKAFRASDALTKHMLIHTGVKRHVCLVCKKAFRIRAHLKSHILTHTGEKRHVCSVCDKACSTLSTLKQHMRIHTGDKPYVCKVCDKAFRFNGNLYAHMKIHIRAKNSL